MGGYREGSYRTTGEAATDRLRARFCRSRAESGPRIDVLPLTYGPVTEVVLGRNGGFKSVTYGATKFICRFVDPRGTGLYDDAVVVVDDLARENYECPDCGLCPVRNA